MIKKQVVKSIKAGYQGSTHMESDSSILVWRIADCARELKLQQKVDNREGNAKPVVDVQLYGHQKMESSSLATFNKKIDTMKEGHATNMEVDDIPACQLVVGAVDADEVDNESGNNNEESALHDD